jgi:hypothetical protein
MFYLFSELSTIKESKCKELMMYTLIFWTNNDISNKTAVNIIRIHKVSVNPTGIKYKFVIQVSKGIKIEIESKNKNRNQIWEEAIKTGLEQLTDYQACIILDSGEEIPTGYQRIPNHIVIYFKNDLRRKIDYLQLLIELEIIRKIFIQ